MMGRSSRYWKLKKEILEAAGNCFSLEQIKEHFAGAINSKRALGKVNNLASFMGVLEERDLLNSRQISYLQELAELLQNDKMKELVHCYKKLYLDGIEEQQCICGEFTSFQPGPFPMSQLQGNQCFSENNNCVIQSLTQAFQNISKGIGENWAVLARALGIKEVYIDLIRDKYPNNHELQALAALKLWLQIEKENASVELLDRALNSKDCLRFGYGSYLLEPNIVLA